MRYPRRHHREAVSGRSCTSSSIANTTLTNVSENRDRDDDDGDDDGSHVEGLQFLAERDMKSLHRGGWGWVVVLCTFLSNCLTTGLLMSGGMLNISMETEFPGSSASLSVSWVTVSAWAVSLAASPLIVHLCRSHSVFISYGLLFGLGAATVRDSSSMMYFKMRRDVAEMWSSAGVGIGILAFSLLYCQAIGSLKWRLGLQAIQSVIVLAFFLGLFFRPASLYHPQRDAISHIKCQKEKVKGVHSKDKLKMKKKNQLLNFTFLKNRRLRLFLIAMSVLALGIYTPLFYVVRHQWEEGGRLMTEHLTLLQLWLGLATSLGSLLGGLLTISQSRHLFISTRLLVQLAMMGAALAMFSLYCVTGYYGYVLSTTLYGLSLGCLLYSSKMYCYNSVKAKDFAHVWSLVSASQSFSSLAGIMVTGYINSTYSKTGYWFSILSVILATLIMSLINIEDDEGVLHTSHDPGSGSGLTNGGLAPLAEFPGDQRQEADHYGDPEISMNYDSKVNKFFANTGDMNGNFKLRQGSLAMLSGRKLSQSDPMLLNSVDTILPTPRGHHQMPARSRNMTSINLWEEQSAGLRRQTTWHKLLDHGVEEERVEEIKEKENGVRLFSKDSTLVIDQITSTV